MGWAGNLDELNEALEIALGTSDAVSRWARGETMLAVCERYSVLPGESSEFPLTGVRFPPVQNYTTPHHGGFSAPPLPSDCMLTANRRGTLVKGLSCLFLVLHNFC